MEIKIPEFALVLLIGASGSGKSTFAKKHFLPTEIISSDTCRSLVCDDETNQAISADAFDLVHYMARKRLKNYKLTVIDATNVQQKARESLLAVAKEYHALPVAIVFKVPDKICIQRNRNRPDRNFGDHVIYNHNRDLRYSIKALDREGFKMIYVLHSVEEIEQATITRTLVWNNKKQEHGPFDIIGDIHGCFDELILLLEKLGYSIENNSISHKKNRKLVFLGDLVDRGPKSPQVLNLVMQAIKEEKALCILGNHENKFLKYLSGKNVKLNHGLENTVAQFEKETEEFKQKSNTFIRSLVSHYVLDDGKLVVAHAGLKEEYHGRTSGFVKNFALYGETTGEVDSYGLPVRLNWAIDYRGSALVVYGHTPVVRAEWLNNTIDIDTGCVFGGKLTALRYPERELVEVKALHTYYESITSFDEQQQVLSAQQENDDILDLEDVFGKKLISTRLRPNILLQAENTAAALEVISRFAANPKWLIYLPPTMAATETTEVPGYLEHPFQAIEYYKQNNVEQVICQEKHMGSRAIIIICQDEAAVQKHFGIINDGIGIIYTRTGRKFFNDIAIEKQLLTHLQEVLEKTNFWQRMDTSWVCLDCEIMPWDLKAQSLLQTQYAPAGRAAELSLSASVKALEAASQYNENLKDLLQHYQERSESVQDYIKAYQEYCWEVNTIYDIKIAPFHILATENQVHNNKPHTWHMQEINKLYQENNSILYSTNYILVDTFVESSVEKAIQWWLTLTQSGKEGMVIKPLHFITMDRGNVLQPGIKCRGREYLRIIYGLEYTLEKNLETLRKRNIKKKSSLALREFALGMEALERFVAKQPLRKVHECVFGVLALESESVDPRL